MSEIMRGWLNGLTEGTCAVEEVEEQINTWINKGYQQGVIDGRKEVLTKASELSSHRLGVPTRRDLTPLNINTPPKENESLKSPFLDKVKVEFDRVAESQEEKGIKKYGHELRPSDNYDWLEMAKEELVDAFKYLEAERARRGK